MGKDFFDEIFEQNTLIKLDVFRRYIREWLPVFATESPTTTGVKRICVYDFFCGPGHDAKNRPGSPIIILEEIAKYCRSRENLKSDIPIHVIFNDKKADHIETLKKKAGKLEKHNDFCTVEYNCRDFQIILEEKLPDICSGDTANLIIMDQFGVSDVTPEIVSALAECNRTDILFFIPSSYIHRFQKVDAFKNIYNFEGPNSDFYTVTRYVCQYFKKKIGDKKFFLAPFSIKSKSNIYGIIFGSGHLRGLQKFLEVCWKIDPKTGEANFAIDRDMAFDATPSMFEEFNEFTKESRFKEDIKALISEKSPDNIEMYEFVLTSGFTPKKARDVLMLLQREGFFSTRSLTGEKSRKGAFYLRHDEKRKIRFVKNPRI